MQNSSITISLLSYERQTVEQSVNGNKRRSPQESSQQLELFAAPDTKLTREIKPQISSIRGVSVKDPNKYQVKFGDHILGAYLTLDEALKLSKRGVK